MIGDWSLILTLGVVLSTCLFSGNAFDGRLSLTKGGGIRIGLCNFSANLFEPINEPEKWMSCEDANAYTWNNDFGDDIVNMPRRDKLKLSRSSGYCPHRRCQLPNVSSSGASSDCPANLCYTKVENGYPSFGACCFKDGMFNSGAVIGHYFKSQPSPKPIYKHNRIVLGGNPADESYESFINANEVFPGLIAAQCPLTGYPSGFANTVTDNKRMILENNVHLWIQLAPYSDTGGVPTAESLWRLHPGKFCEVIPLQYYPGGQDGSSGSEDFAKGYTLTAYCKRDKTPAEENFVMGLDPPEGQCAEEITADGIGAAASRDACAEGWRRVESTVRHLWFYAWDDFAVPGESSIETIVDMAEDAASVILSGESVVVSCFSGRGRSGTFAAIVAAKVKGLETSSGVVDEIVTMRRSRDGLVETPQQMKFVLNVLARGSHWYHATWLKHLSIALIFFICTSCAFLYFPAANVVLEINNKLD